MKNIDLKMADITRKPITLREAKAQGRIYLKSETIRMIRNKKIPKGDVLNVAQCAGILAAKRTDELIPLCHPLPLEHVGIEFKLEKNSILITVIAKTESKTGIEMEAMTACAISALTIYDMCKFRDRGAVISQIKLIQKKGGKSGDYKRK